MRKMKDSGIEWIGEIPENWGKLFAFQCFSQVKNKNIGMVETNLLSLSYGNLKRKNIDTVEGLLPESFETYNIIEANDIVLRLTDLQNDQKSLRVGLSNERGIITSAYVTLRNKSSNLPKYFYYYLHSFDISKGFYGMGAGVRQGLNWEELKHLELLSPPIEEQSRIAAYLDTQCAHIDSVIEKTKQSIEEYKKLKQAVITQAVTKGVRGEREMKDSGIEWIGEIPSDWSVPQIKYIARIASGSTPDRNKPEYWNGTIKWLKTGELQNNIITDSEEHITDIALKETSVNLFSKDTILIAMYGQGKTRGMTALLAEPCTTNQACAGLTINSNKITVLFLWKCLIGAYNGIREMAQGTGQPNLNAQLISDFHIPLPPIIEQEEIVMYLEKKVPQIDTLITKKEQFLTELESYKKSMIYEYVTGKKEVEP